MSCSSSHLVVLDVMNLGIWSDEELAREEDGHEGGLQPQQLSTLPLFGHLSGSERVENLRQRPLFPQCGQWYGNTSKDSDRYNFANWRDAPGRDSWVRARERGNVVSVTVLSPAKPTPDENDTGQSDLVPDESEQTPRQPRLRGAPTQRSPRCPSERGPRRGPAASGFWCSPRGTNRAPTPPRAAGAPSPRTRGDMCVLAADIGYGMAGPCGRVGARAAPAGRPARRPARSDG